jgi:Kdo2-lipid IVA 3' secondary acyltransferase
VRWAVWLGGPLIRLLASTWKFEEVNDAPWRQLRAEGIPFIFTLWHGHLLAQTWLRRKEGITTMISEHRDGEIIARLVESWGYRTVRGSTSRGAGRALLGMVRDLASGKEFAITPDGPRGPAGTAQPGVLMASQRARAPIVPMRSEVSDTWRMKSWDRFMIPKPFARIRVIYGDPWVATSVEEDGQRELEQRMGPALPPGVAPGRAKGRAKGGGPSGPAGAGGAPDGATP